jgi:hypothetical protein
VVTLTLIALFIAVAALLALFVTSTYAAGPWWRWRTRTPLPPLSSQQSRDLSTVGGWLAVTVVTSGLLLLYLLFTLGEVGESLGSTWLLAAAAPAMRTVLLVEVVTHLFQGIAVATGILLIVRRSPAAPPFWVGYLTLLALSVIWDGAAAPGLLRALTTAVGSDGSEMMSQVRATETQNSQTLLRAAIWTLYWVNSMRVRLVFSPLPLSSMATEDTTAAARVDPEVQLPSHASS